MTRTNCCLYKADSPDDEQQACSKHIEAYYTKLNSVALVRERTIPTERPPPVGEVVPTFADRGVSRG